MNKEIINLVAVAVLTSCMQVELEDVSSDEMYADFIGERYKSNVELLIHGITTDRNYSDAVDYFRVTSKPGVGGPEVLSRGVLEIGTVIRVEKVMACTNCYLDSRIYVQIEVLSEEDYRDHPVRIRATANTEIIKYSNDKAEINPVLFTKAPN